MRGMLARRGVKHRYLQTSAGKIGLYDVPGNGELPTVVLLHGISASASGFAPVFMRLRQHVKRVIVPDYPGHGLSDDPSVKLTLDALFEAMTGALDEVLGDEPFVLVGNSLGGAVALDYVLKRRDRVKALVLLSPAGARSSPEELREVLRAFDVRNRREALDFLTRVYHRPRWMFHLLAHELPANLRRPGVRDLFASITADRTLPEADLKKLPMPILLVWGESERLLPYSHFEWWRSRLPRHTVISQPERMGHCPHLDAPVRVSFRIESFIRDHAKKPS